MAFLVWVKFSVYGVQIGCGVSVLHTLIGRYKFGENMNIECPSCSKENKIEYGENILCCECNSTFAGHTYKKFKKPLLSASSALLIGVFGTYKIEQLYFDEQRYPVRVEYEIVDNCVNSDKRAMTTDKYVEKKNLCLCALELTMNSLSYKEATGDEANFLNSFRTSLNQCK
ncbi:hypothetical protein KCU36_004302 [Vibrio vulnificus]|nr:hypothetical protein [Vibrio vulnificus]